MADQETTGRTEAGTEVGSRQRQGNTIIGLGDAAPATTLLPSKINRAAISRATGTDMAHISRIFSHKTRAGFDTARRIAWALDVSLADLCAFLGEDPRLLPGAPFPYPNNESQLGPIPGHFVSDKVRLSHTNPCRHCPHRDRFYRGHFIGKPTEPLSVVFARRRSGPKGKHLPESAPTATMRDALASIGKKQP